jgi:hypothetical protein
MLTSMTEIPRRGVRSWTDESGIVSVIEVLLRRAELQIGH